MNNNTGIYAITSSSGKQYVGSSKDLKARWRIHRTDLRAGNHHNTPLQGAFNLYGEEALIFSVLLYCDAHDLLMYEQRAIDVLKPEYNICKTAGNRLGVKHRPETVAKYAAALRGRKWSTEHREKMMQLRQTPEHIAAMKLANEKKRGRKLSDEHKAKLSAATKGRPKSPEAVANSTSAMMVAVRDPAHRARISAALKGRSFSPEHRAKLSAAAVGKRMSDEFRAKQSAVQKARSPELLAKIAAATLQAHGKPVRNIETGQIFPAVVMAAAWVRDVIGIPSAAAPFISSVCKGRYKTAYGYRWEFVGSESSESTSAPEKGFQFCLHL